MVARLLNIAQKIEGLYRHASTHAAGIVIGDRPLAQLVPLYRDPRSDMPVTQFNMKWVEQAGLVKFDFLGLKTLTVLKVAVDFIAKRNISVDLSALPLDDKLTYEMLSRGETVGVFQVESAGMRKALIGMRPDCIEDIIALVALYRPGPMENIPVYNARKHGEEEIESVHPTIDYLLRKRRASSSTRNRSCRSPRSCRATRSAKPTFCAAPWVRRSRRRWTSSASASSRAPSPTRSPSRRPI